MKEYEGFSKQDLIDRKGAIQQEMFDMLRRYQKNQQELKRIDKLLEEMK